MEFLAILQGCSPVAQVILALSLFVLIIAIIRSRRATRNVCACIDAIARLLAAKREPPQEPPLRKAA